MGPLVTILVCAAGLARADCTPDTAVAVVRPPAVISEGFPGPMGCMLLGQRYAAELHYVEDPGYYVKVDCPRRG